MHNAKSSGDQPGAEDQRISGKLYGPNKYNRPAFEDLAAHVAISYQLVHAHVNISQTCIINAEERKSQANL